ncbi:hypothetical protein KDL29_14310 [bacterium]|nr:hypothetical protein [bacterium]
MDVIELKDFLSLVQYCKQVSTFFGESKQAHIANHFDKSGENELGSLINKIKKTIPISSVMSETHLVDSTIDLLFSIEKANCNSQIHNLYLDYVDKVINYSEEFSHHVPVSGIVVNFPFVIGRIKFVPIHDGYYEYMQNYSDRIKSASDVSSGGIINHLTNEATKKSIGKSIGIVEIIGSLDEGSILALDLVRQALEVLLFLIRPSIRLPFIHRLMLRTGNAMSEITMIALGVSNESMHLNQTAISGYLEYTFDVNTQQYFEGIIPERINDIILASPSTRTDFEKSILYALHWYYEGWHADLPRNKLLYFTIVMEILLKRSSEYAISRYISENAALILETDPTNRISFSDKVRKIYDLRSKIVHDGYNDVEMEEIVFSESVAYQLINFSISISDEIKSTKQFRHYLLTLRMQRGSE